MEENNVKEVEVKLDVEAFKTQLEQLKKLFADNAKEIQVTVESINKAIGTSVGGAIDKELNDMLKKYKTYVDKKKEIEVKYDKEIKKIRESGNEVDAEKAEKGKKKAIGELRSETHKKINEDLALLPHASSATILPDRFKGVSTGANGILTSIEAGGGKVSSGLKAGVAGATEALDGLSSIQLNNPISWVTGALKAASGIIKATVGIKDGAKEDEIQRQQEKVNTLQKEYDKLQKTLAGTFSMEFVNKMEEANNKLIAQQAAINTQISNEKGKKKSDEGKIEQWKQKQESINEQLQANKKKSIDAIFGSDVQSAINDFATAIAESWSGGTEAGANKAKDLTKKMIKGIVNELLKSNISDKVEGLRNRIAELMKNDGVLDDSEIAEIESTTAGIVETEKRLGEQYSKIYKEGIPADSITGAIRGTVATEQSVSELGGIFRGQWESLKSIANSSLGITDIARINASIAANTLRTADNTDGLVTAVKSLELKLDNIDRNTKIDNARY